MSSAALFPGMVVVLEVGEAGGLPTLAVRGAYDYLQDGGLEAAGWTEPAGYEYLGLGGAPHYPEASFGDEAPLRHIPLVYYRDGWYTRVGLFAVDPEVSGLYNTLEARRPVQTDDQQAAYWALVPLARNRVLLVLGYHDYPSGYYLGAVYEWGEGPPPGPEPRRRAVRALNCGRAGRPSVRDAGRARDWRGGGR